MDADSNADFNVQLESLYPVWNEREKVARKLSEGDEPEFFNYFSRSIANDMKRTMLEPVRKSAGEFYFNNESESMNAQLKQRKKAEKTGKMTWLDGISLVEGMVQEQERNIERAVIDEGPYQLCREVENLKVDPDEWLELSEREKSRRLFKLQVMKVPPSGAVNRDVLGTSNETSDINITELVTRQLPKTVGLKPGSASARKRSRNLVVKTGMGKGSLRSWRDFAREYLCFGCEDVNGSGEAVGGLVKSRVEFPPAQIRGVF